MSSITTSLTAVAVLRLVEAGALSLSDAVADHVDYFGEAPGEPITHADLLSHAPGMSALDPGAVAQRSTGLPAGMADEADRRRLVRESIHWRATDRERFMYYKTGYGVLGRVVEAVDGWAYATHVREGLLEPLGTERATFHRKPLDTDYDAMTGF
jgi:CubicO group peptidase (beta-lactamase class C family)